MELCIDPCMHAANFDSLIEYLLLLLYTAYLGSLLGARQRRQSSCGDFETQARVIHVWHRARSAEFLCYRISGIYRHHSFCFILLFFSEKESTRGFIGKLYFAQVGPGLVYLTFKSFFGEGAFVQSLLPLGPLEQQIVHEVWGEWSLPTVIAKFFLHGEAIQVGRASGRIVS